MGQICRILVVAIAFFSPYLHQILNGTDNSLKKVGITGKGFTYIHLTQLPMSMLSTTFKTNIGQTRATAEKPIPSGPVLHVYSFFRDSLTSRDTVVFRGYGSLNTYINQSLNCEVVGFNKFSSPLANNRRWKRFLQESEF